MDAVVSHDHEEQVVQDEVGAQVAGLLGSAGQFGDRVHRVFAACGDDQTFYLLYSENKFTGNGDLMVYSFRLPSTGAVTGLAEINGAVITGQTYLGLDGGFAVSPDGTELAIAKADAAKDVPQALAEQIILINTRTGARVTWKGGLNQADSPFNIEDLSWTADSDSLVYPAQWCPQGDSAGALIHPDGTELTALVQRSDTNLRVVTIDIGTEKTEACSTSFRRTTRSTTRSPSSIWAWTALASTYWSPATWCMAGFPAATWKASSRRPGTALRLAGKPWEIGKLRHTARLLLAGTPRKNLLIALCTGRCRTEPADRSSPRPAVSAAHGVSSAAVMPAERIGRLRMVRAVLRAARTRPPCRAALG